MGHNGLNNLWHT